MGCRNNEEMGRPAPDSRWTLSTGSLPSWLIYLTFLALKVFICKMGTIEAALVWVYRSK